METDEMEQKPKRKGKKLKNPHLTKEDFLAELEKCHGNCYKAYSNIGLPYGRYYAWRKEDPEFNEACERLQQSMVKLAESKMFELINEGNPSMIKFYLNCKGNYNEKKEIKVDSTNVVDINKTISDIKDELR